MKKQTKGAWIINHTNKLKDFSDISDFEDVELAGKCGIFLSNLSASDEESELNKEKVSAIARISNIKKSEIETIKKILKDEELIDTSKSGGISVLGVTTSSILSHTSTIFDNLTPNKFQTASLELSENTSEFPKNEMLLKEFISDEYNIEKEKTDILFNQSEQIGFIDYEKLDDDSKIYFNGNLFRREDINKTNAVLGSLNGDDVEKINKLDSLLNENGCLTYENGKNILGNKLFSKLLAIGMYDLNELSNSNEVKYFLTKPSAFSKFGNPFEEDALDLAKAFVSSLYYGMNFSKSSRGQIKSLSVLLRALIRGDEIGPATAIGEDYKLLELKRVVELRHYSGDRYFMKLLKKDIGKIALQVLETGDAVSQIVTSNVYSTSVSNYIGPEQNRTIRRKRQNPENKKSVLNLLRTIRN